jgi:hypothetical protein
MKKATPALLLAGLAVAACLQAQAAEPQAASGAENAQMVGIDAQTGKLRPLTAIEARALAARAATMPRQKKSVRATAPRTAAESKATMRRLPNGAISMRTPLSAMTSVQATRASDGSVRIVEADGDAPAPAPRTQEVSE